MGIPASRPRKAKPVEMRRTERLCSAFDHSQATMATAIPTTTTCQSRPFRRCRFHGVRRMRRGISGVDIVTAWKS